MISLLLLLGALRSASAGPRLQEPLPAAEVVPEGTLGALQSAPAHHLGREVRFAAQLAGLQESWNPYLSRFDTLRWLELEVWPDELFTWDEGVFDNPVGHLFVRRGGGFEPLVRRARRYERFEIRGRVREVFLGVPWIEVLEITPLEGEIGEGTILHVTRARELLFQGQFALALEQYERARAAPLPPHALNALLAEIRVAEETRARNKELEGRAPEERAGE